MLLILTVLICSHLIWFFDKSNKGEIKPSYLEGYKTAFWHTLSLCFLSSEIKIKYASSRIIQGFFLILILVLSAIYLSKFSSDYNQDLYKSLFIFYFICHKKKKFRILKRIKNLII